MYIFESRSYYKYIFDMFYGIIRMCFNEKKMFINFFLKVTLAVSLVDLEKLFARSGWVSLNRNKNRQEVSRTKYI